MGIRSIYTGVCLECEESVFPKQSGLATCKPRASHEIQSRVPYWVHNLELFFTLSHTLPLHDSHLNTEFLNAELQVNLA